MIRYKMVHSGLIFVCVTYGLSLPTGSLSAQVPLAATEVPSQGQVAGQQYQLIDQGSAQASQQASDQQIQLNFPGVSRDHQYTDSNQVQLPPTVVPGVQQHTIGQHAQVGITEYPVGVENPRDSQVQIPQPGLAGGFQHTNGLQVQVGNTGTSTSLQIAHGQQVSLQDTAVLRGHQVITGQEAHVGNSGFFTGRENTLGQQIQLPPARVGANQRTSGQEAVGAQTGILSATTFPVQSRQRFLIIWPNFPIWPRCGPHQVYRVCASSSCGERKCHRPWSTACTRDCGKGCFCGPAYCRNKEGLCVRDEYSPPRNAYCYYTRG